MEKTNVMRTLDRLKIEYEAFCYKDTGVTSGADVARVLNQNPDEVFKTLVTVSKSNTNYVFMIPVLKELDLKKAAAAVGEKALSMLKSKELLPLTGYVHGGCSPIGMKKNFVTVADISAESLDTIIFSAGKIGYQVKLAVKDLKKAVRIKFFDVTVE